jgi:tRNA-Thr(GGU) m(6)t(6)A37 methyltransferase TsaA
VTKQNTYAPIGVIHSDHAAAKETPIQPVFAAGMPGRIDLDPKYEEGLQGLSGFSHLILLYHLHQAGPPQLTVTPFMGTKPTGLFATRHPRRPNPIGISTVRLVRIQGCQLFLEDVDILDNTPLLDIKPYVPRFDAVDRAAGGWTESVDDETAQKRGMREYMGRERA